MRILALSFAAFVIGLVLCKPGISAPNIVVVMTDDQRDADPIERMPNTEALLVQQGLRFTNSFAVNPVCCASRASFLSGQYSHNDNVWDNEWTYRPGGFQAFLNDDNTIACWLQAQGYHTALIGKYLNGYGKDSGKKYRPPCWTYWWGLTVPYRYYDYEANDDGVIRRYGVHHSSREYQEDVVSRLAQKFISKSAKSQQPFFVWITAIGPHAGYPAKNTPEPPRRYKGYFKDLKLPKPPNFNEADFSDKPQFLQEHQRLMNANQIDLARRSYQRRAETVLAADDMVGAIMGELQSLGVLENTYVVFTSDNGFFNGEHRRSNGKHLLYEESIRVPLVIRGPSVPAGQTRAELVNNLDLTATLVDLAGATAGRSLDGHSLVPLFAGDQPWRTAMLLEGVDKLDNAIYGYYSAVRTANYKYAEHVDDNENYAGNEFYDLAADPYELESRPDDPNYQQIVDRLKSLLGGLNVCSGDSCWITDQLPRPPAVPKVKPDIGKPCNACRGPDLSHWLETDESPTTR